MSIIKPFKCTRPNIAHASIVAALPYDVYSRQEAYEIVKENPLSFLAIDRAETNFDPSVDIYSDMVYEKAASLLETNISNQIFVEDEVECMYLYELIMDGRSQTGIVACSSVDDYINGIIKKHENTRTDKELDRTKHVDYCNAHTGPIFLAYRTNEVLKKIIEKKKADAPLYDFVSSDGIAHKVYQISEPELINQIQNAFAEIPYTYIADGHHRAASAVNVAKKRREDNPNYTGEEEFNFFLSVAFSEDELYIMDYNRVVKDLNGFTTDEFLEEMKKKFQVAPIEGAERPKEKGSFTMLLDKQWYLCKIGKEMIPSDPVESLDVSILQKQLLTPILGIGDPKTDKRIDFVGGIRGLEELEKRCDTDCKVAFAMYPTSIQELFHVADNDLLMPPKSTWFEPKLRSGLFVHKI